MVINGKHEGMPMKRNTRGKIGISYLVFFAIYIGLIAIFLLTLFAIPKWTYTYELHYANNLEQQLQEIFETNDQATLRTALIQLRDTTPFEIAVYQQEKLLYSSLKITEFNAHRGTIQKDSIIKEVQGVIEGKAGIYQVWYAIYPPQTKGYLNTLISLQSVYILLSFIILVTVILLLQRRMQRPLQEIKENLFKMEKFELESLSDSDDIINQTAYRFANQLHGKIRAVSRKHTELEYELESERERLTNLMTVSRGLIHDLKTPLHRSMLENEQYLQNQKNITPVLKEITRYNIEQYDGVIRQVNDILSLMNSDIEYMAQNKDIFDIVYMVQEIRTLFTPYLKERSLWLTIEGPETLPIQLNRVAAHLIIHNMFSNAVQYAIADTEVEFTIEVVGEQIQLICSNQTDATNTERLLHSTELFYAIEETDKTHTYSTGNGLYLIKELAHLIGGTYTLEVEQGSVHIIVMLPFSDMAGDAI